MKPLSRRTILMGLGTAIALPWLEAMGPLASAAGTAPASPRRMAFFYVPNGIHMADWTPKAEGAGFELPAILQPLQEVKNDFLVLTGLTADKARANGDGGGDHARALSAFLTGCQAKKTHGADIRAGITVDQVAAKNVGLATKFRSLELGCDRGLQSGNWRGQRPGQTGYTNFDHVDGRIDHNLTTKDLIFGRFSYRRLPVLGQDNNLPPAGHYDEIRGTRSAVLS